MTTENTIPDAKPKILPPKVDVVFKLLFADTRNEDILTDFLKSILNLPEDEYESVFIVDPQLKRETIDDKLGIVDVKLTTKSGTIIHIEIQVAQEPSLPERITYYISKILAAQLKAGAKYYELEKVISIAIADFNIIEGSDAYYHAFQLYENTTGIRFTDIVEIHTLELQKISDQSDNTARYDWARFLKAEKEEEFDMIANNSPAVKKAVAKLKQLSQDEEAQILYEARQKAIMDENTRLFSARRDEKYEIAKNFIKMGLPIEQISKGTGLTIKEIEKVKENKN